MLECVDGSVGEEELSFMCGLPPSGVAEILARLALLNLVGYELEAPPPVARPRSSFGDDIELPLEFRAEVDALFGRLGDENYYRLLGLTPKATKEEIRVAYYRTGPRFHPDKHFRKNLGSYKAKIEAVFATLTKAHDTLRFEARRADYDAKLSGTGQAVSAPAVPTAAPSVAPPPFAAPPRRSASSAPAAEAPSVEEEEALRRARREALARKLGSVAAAPAPPAPPVTIPSTTTRAVVPPSASVVAPTSHSEVLRERFEKVAGDVKDKRLKRYLQSAEDAMNLGDYRTAAAAYVQASKLDPSDTELAKRAEQAAKLGGFG